MVKASKAKAQRAIKAGAKTTKKVQASKPAPTVPAENTKVLNEAALEAAKSAAVNADLINRLVTAIEAQQAKAGPAQPVRLKVHRDQRNLIEFIDVVPVEIVKH